MAGKGKQPSYTALVRDVVWKAEAPIPATEILRRVHQLRPVVTISPQNTIRSAISQCRLIANTGDGKYWWYPRLIKGSRVRVRLIASDTDQERIVFDEEARELLWPSFFAGYTQSDRDPVTVELPVGGCVKWPLEHFGNTDWGTTGSPDFWQWLQDCEAAGGDALIVEASDAEARRYRVSFDAEPVRDQSAIRRRTMEVELEAREYWWKRRASGVADWDIAKYLLAAGHYRNPVPPEPLSMIWSRIHNQMGLLEALAERRRAGPRKSRAKARRLHQLKITLTDYFGESQRPIWRRLLIADNTTLADLHWIIQLSMGWTHSHLHMFVVDGTHYSDPLFELDDPPYFVEDEFRMTLGRVTDEEPSQFYYEYDFGDSWRHEILLEETLPLDLNISPRCLAGEGACPPEDCGGLPGYDNFLAAIGDRDHPEHEELLTWVGWTFDPDRCDLDGINWGLQRLAAV
jgi:hypothetical protein